MASTTEAAPGLPPDAFDDRSATVIGVVAFCLFFSTVMVGLRLWTRIKIINQVGIDDYACVVGLLVTYGSGIAIAHMTKYGLGKHIYGLDPASIPGLVPLYLRDFYVSIVFYCAALMALKLSFLFGYYRVLAVQQMRIVYIVAIVIVGGWALSQVLVGIFICTPVEGFWNKSIDAKCMPNIPQWYINAGGNIITDIAVFALPLPALWKLKLPKPQRIMLVGIFCLGFFTVVISIIRIRYLKLFDDFTWENVPSSCWSIGELSSAITCCCLPTLRPLASHYFPAMGSMVGRSSKGYAKSGQFGSSVPTDTVGSKIKSKNSRQSMGFHSNNATTTDSQIELGLGRKTSADDATSLGGASSAGSIGRDQIVALNPTVRTDIRPLSPEGTYEEHAAPPSGVTVKRDVYMVSSRR